MGHAIDYLTIKDGKNARDEIRWAADDFYACEHDWGENPSSKMPYRIDFHDRIFDTEKEARDFIDEHDYSYAQIAVLFKDYSHVKKRGKVTRAEEAAKKADTEFREVSNRFHFANHKAAYIGCPSCGSKISREHLRQNRCPVCHSDMRPASTLASIENKRAKAKELAKKASAVQQEWKKTCVKHGQVFWLVKVECHC